jgi:GxxExxY protein
MPREKLLHADLTDAIIKSFYHVYNTLGFGFLEKVYENSMVFSLRNASLFVIPQMPVEVYFETMRVGTYFADLLVSNLVIVEVKSVEKLHPAHEAQLINYLKATDIEVGLLLNLGEKPEFRRKVFSNDRKQHRSVPKGDHG